jgi:DedD protein
MKNVSLTSRIVGAIVILSFGIIFIPVLLETNQIDTDKMNQSPIPEIPSEISTIVFQLNEETGKFEEKSLSPAEQFELEVAKEIEDSANEEVLGEPSQINAKGEGKRVSQEPSEKEDAAPKLIAKAGSVNTADKSQHSWMLQVASFKNKSKALKLRNKLRTKHYVTHISERKQDSGSIWRVRIGPDLSKAKIEKIQGILEEEMGLRGLIVRRR